MMTETEANAWKRLADSLRTKAEARRVLQVAVDAEIDSLVVAMKDTSAVAMARRIVELERDLAAHKELLGTLNSKLDETHTHRCFNCEKTVTEETAKRQAAP